MSSMADVINRLPDSLLCHILSFLTTKEAAATSILSKRWEYLWHSLLSLDFSNIKVNDRETYFCFNEFVYSVLLSRRSIKSFILDIEYHDRHLGYLGYPNVVKWVNAVVQCGVQSLHFELNCSFMPKLPNSILTCRTLVVLKFCWSTLEIFSSITLPSLKILHFESVNFANLRHFLLFLAGCPVLEDLHAASILFYTQETLTYRECNRLSLSKLTRADMLCCYFNFPLTALHNVESLRIEIDKMYSCGDDIPTFRNLTSLKLLSLNCKWQLLVEVLNHCPKLQNFDLDEATADGVREDAHENWVDPEVVPQCLSQHLKTCNLQNFLGLQGELRLARYILKSAKVLQTMTIRSNNKKQLEIERSLSSCPRASTTCLLSIWFCC